MALGFFDSKMTPDQLANRRQELDFLASRIGRATNVGSGVGDILTGLAVGLGRRNANKIDQQNTEAGNSAWDAFMGGLNKPSTAPSMPSTASSATAPLNAPVAPPMGAEMGTFGQSPQNSFSGTGVAAAGKGWTDIVGPDGKVIHREGSRNWRNNNPGNIEFGNFAKSNGAIGTDGRFAVFPSYEAGRKAKEALLFNSPSYRDKTIAGAISRYAPQFENNTSSYIKNVADAAGVSPFTPLSQLSPQQRSAMMDAMQRVEGFKAGRETIGGKPVQVASNDPQQAFNVQPASLPPQAPPQAPQEPQMAQAAPQQPMQEPPQQGGSNRLQELINLAGNPYITNERRQIVHQMLQQEMQNQDPMRQMQMQAAQQGLDKGALEMQYMQHPDQQPMSPMQKLQYETGQQQLEQLRNPAPKPADPFTLQPGDIRFDGSGKQIASGGEKVPTNPVVETMYDEKTGQAYKAQWNPKTNAWDRVGGNKADSNGITITNPDGTTTQIGGSGGKMTEADHKAQLLAQQVVGQEKDLMSKFDTLGSVQNSVPDSMGGRALQSGDAQIAKDSLKNVVANWLYLTSGATATPQEVDRQFSIIEPSVFDKPEAKAGKKARLQAIIDTMKARANIKTNAATKPVEQMSDQELEAIVNGQ